MTLEDARRKLGVALADPRRRQLAHIAILDLAMALRQPLEASGLSRALVDEATEAISAYLTGDIDRLPLPDGITRSLSDIVDDAIMEIGQDPSFAALFQ